MKAAHIQSNTKEHEPYDSRNSSFHITDNQV